MDINKIQRIIIDVELANSSHTDQEQLADTILILLEREFKVYLFSSNPNHDISQEDFSNPNLEYLPKLSSNNFTSAQPLSDQHTLWICEDQSLFKFIKKSSANLATHNTAKVEGIPSIHFSRLSEVSLFLDYVLRISIDIDEYMENVLQKNCYLLGIAGPYMSGYEKYAVRLRELLESRGNPVVEILHLGDFLNGEQLQPRLKWLIESVINPLRNKQEVVISEPKPIMTKALKKQLPFYCHSQSIIILEAERLFHNELIGLLDCAVLLNVSDKELTRRIYEIPPQQEFSDEFIAQCREHYLSDYHNYAQRNNINQLVHLLVDVENRRRPQLSYNQSQN